MTQDTPKNSDLPPLPSPASGAAGQSLNASHGSELLEQWETGLGLPGTLVIDGHIHIGEWPHTTTYMSVEQAAEGAVADMDANGVNACCSMGGGYMFAGGSDYRLGNDFLLAVTEKIPERLIPFACFNPNDTRDKLMAELDRMFDAGVRCIKLINGYQEAYPGDGPNLMALYEYASDHRMLVFDHGWKHDIIMNISAQFPGVDFIYGHYSQYTDAAINARDNVYSNIWLVGDMGWLDRGIASVGADKLMFGSDAFMNCVSCGIGPIVYAPISDDDKRLMLGLNQARLLDKVGALPPGLKETFATHSG